jgi:hypothetical protein
MVATSSLARCASCRFLRQRLAPQSQHDERWHGTRPADYLHFPLAERARSTSTPIIASAPRCSASATISPIAISRLPQESLVASTVISDAYQCQVRDGSSSKNSSSKYFTPSSRRQLEAHTYCDGTGEVSHQVEYDARVDAALSPHQVHNRKPGDDAPRVHQWRPLVLKGEEDSPSAGALRLLRKRRHRLHHRAHLKPTPPRDRSRAPRESRAGVRGESR